MKIKIDNKNKVVICTGYYAGKQLKAIARCSSEDEFDEEFGIRLAKAKYKLKKTQHKYNIIYKSLRHFEKQYSIFIERLFETYKKATQQQDEIDNIIGEKY